MKRPAVLWIVGVLCAAAAAACGDTDPVADRHGSPAAAATATQTSVAIASPTPRREAHHRKRKATARAGATATAMPATSMVACDPNISARAATTSCGFAENVFYAFYEDATSSNSQNAIHAYSTASHTDYAVACATDAGHVTCVAGDGGEVRFDLAAVRAYNDDQASAYAANHDLGPNVGTDAGTGASGGSGTDAGNDAPGSGGGTSDPSSGATSPEGDPPLEDRIPNYDNGTGYPVQCADGMWSQSGGRPGACSHHGGVG